VNRAAIWLALALFAFAAFAQPGPSVVVTRTLEPIQLDGRLDEAVWHRPLL
jgi:hypothetical protein